jgi:hypothetical protein
MNPVLEVGDEVILLHMDGESQMNPGLKGVVLSKSKVFGDDQYVVKWENGSQLSLISSADAWDKLENFNKRKQKKESKEIEIDKKDINEVDEYERSKTLMSNIDVFKNFNMKFLNDYLKMIKDSGIVNMLGAAPYLYMGKRRIQHEFEYKNISNEDEFETVLDNADQAQAEMINGVMNVLGSEKKEMSLENINRYLRKYSTKVLMNYIHLF